MSLGGAALEQCPHYVRRDDDGTVAAMLAAAADPVEWIVEMLADPEAMADPSRARSDRLSWLAALAGVDLTGVPEVPEADRRGFIADPVTVFRGTRDAIRLRVGLTLTGSRSVFIICPHQGDPLHMLIQTLTSETPDAAETASVARREVPAGLRLTHQVISGMTYNQLAARYPTYDAMKATGKTYSQLATEAP